MPNDTFSVISQREQVTIYEVMLPLYKTVISWREQVTIYHVMLPLYKTNTLNLIYFCASSLKQQSIGRHVGPLRFQANQSLLIRLNAVYAKCLVDKQQIPILQELLTPPDSLSSSPVFFGFFWGIFLWSSCCSIFSFLLIVLQIIFRPFDHFLLTIVLSILLRFTASDCSPLVYLTFLLVFGLIRMGLEPTNYHSRSKYR